MNFFETNMGKNFFQAQVPKLVGALTEIAQTLRTPKPVFQIQAEIPSDFLARLYHGDFDASYVADSPEVTACTQKIMQFQQEFYKDLPLRTREQIEDYRTLLDERCIRQSEQAFAAGFRCAMTMLAAGLAAPTLDGTKELSK